MHNIYGSGDWEGRSVKCLLHKQENMSSIPESMIKKKKSQSWWSKLVIPERGRDGRISRVTGQLP